MYKIIGIEVMADKTFSDTDIIRLYLNHLTGDERISVERFFEGSDIDIAFEIFDIVIDVAGLIPGIGEIFELVGVAADVIQLNLFLERRRRSAEIAIGLAQRLIRQIDI